MSETTALLASKNIFDAEILSSVKMRIGVCDDVIVAVWLEQNGEFIHISDSREAVRTLAMHPAFAINPSSYSIDEGTWHGLRMRIV